MVEPMYTNAWLNMKTKVNLGLASRQAGLPTNNHREERWRELAKDMKKPKENSKIASKSQTFTIDPEEKNVSKITQNFMYEAEIEKLKKDKAEKETIIAEQSLQISSLQKSLQGRTRKSLIIETKGYNEQTQQALAKSLQSAQKIHKLENDLSVARYEKESLEAQLKEIQKLLEQEQLNRNSSSLDQYKQSMRTLKQEKMDLNKVLTIAVRVIEQAQADRDKMSEQLSKSLNSNEKLRNEKLTETNELIEENDKLIRKIGALKEKDEENQAFEKECKRISNTQRLYILRIRKCLAESEKEKTFLESTIKDRMELINQLQTEITDLKNQNKSLVE